MYILFFSLIFTCKPLFNTLLLTLFLLKEVYYVVCKVITIETGIKDYSNNY